MSDRTPQNQDKYVLRLPDGMRDRIKAAAARNDRSMNAEIVHALSYWLEIDLPSDVQLGPGTDAAEVGRQDWEGARLDRERHVRRELERSVLLLQDLIRDLKIGRPPE